MSPNGLHRVLSGFLSSPKSRNRPLNANGPGSRPKAEPQSAIAQILFKLSTLKEDPPLNPSTSSDKAQEHKDGSHPPASNEPDRQTLDGSEVDVSTNDAERGLSAPSCSGLSQTYQSPATDSQVLLCQKLEKSSGSAREIRDLQLELEQAKLDLLLVKKENHALKQNVHRQDEGTQMIKESLRAAKRQFQSLQADLEMQLESIAVMKTMNTKVKKSLNVVTTENERLQEDLDDTNRRLKLSKQALMNKTSQFQELSDTRDNLEKSLRISHRNNGSLKDQLEEAQSKIKSLTKWKNNAMRQIREGAATIQAAEALYDEFKPKKDRMQSYEAQITKLKSLLESKTSVQATLRTQLALLRKEKETWQGRMDTMTHKVFASERRLRMLNHTAAQALRPQRIVGDNSGHVIVRGSNKKPDTPSVKVIGAVKMLNGRILEAAIDFAPLFLFSYSDVWSGDLSRANAVLGEWVTSLLHKEESWNHPLVLQSVIQMFLVDWCRAIIEAWYPKQQSFAELFLTGLKAQKTLPSNGNDVITFKTIQITKTSLPDFDEWATHILDDLLQILPALGNKSYRRENVLLPKLTHLARLSYEIRQALAEEDICGNLQLFIPPSDLQFKPDSMNVVGLEVKKKAPSDLGDIAGSTSIGLKSMFIRKSDAGASSICCTIVLEPNVVLARDMVAKTDPNSAE